VNMKIIALVLIIAICLLGAIACGAVPAVSPSPSSTLTPMEARTPAITMISAQTAVFSSPSAAPTGSSESGAESVKVSIQAANFNIADKIGATNVYGEGHLIYYLDAVPPTVLGQPATVSGEDVVESTITSNIWYNESEGIHTFSVQLVNNDSTPLSSPVVASVICTVTQIDSIPFDMAAFTLMSTTISSRFPLPSPPTSVSREGFDMIISTQSEGRIIAEALGQTDPEEPAIEVCYYMDKLPPVIPNGPGVSRPGTFAKVPASMYTWHNVQPGLHTFAAELVKVDGSSLNPPQVFAVTINVESASSAPPSGATLYPASTSAIPRYIASPVGEWMLLDRNFGSGIIGEINGKDYLFAAVDNGIMILDPQNRENPTKVAYLESQDPMNISGLVVSGTVLYVSKSDYLWIIDVSDPAAPRELSKLSTVKPLGTVISGHYAYINDNGERITIVDISHLADPQVIGNFALPLQSPIQVIKVSGSLLFVLDAPIGYPITRPNGLYIIDISSPRSLKQLCYFPDNHPGYPIIPPVPWGSPIQQPSVFSDMAIVGNYAFMAASGPDGMPVLDISNPSAPKEIFHVPQTGAERIRVAGNLAFLASGCLEYIVDISNPNNPKVISYFDATSFAGDVYSYSDFIVLGNRIYFLVNSQTRRGIKVLDASALSK
jgi:hypothetical protein